MSENLKIEMGQHYVTGIPGIDLQHKNLFMMVDNIIKSLKDDDLANDIVQAAIQHLLDYLRSHLFTEENLMEIIAFPRLNDHKAQHRNLINLMTEEKKILKVTDNKTISSFLRSYRNIGLTHITVYDREYADYVADLMATKKKYSIVSLKEKQAVAG